MWEMRSAYKFLVESQLERVQSQERGIDGRKILKLIRGKLVLGCEMDLCSSE
jgi:hypothetical protein